MVNHTSFINQTLLDNLTPETFIDKASEILAMPSVISMWLAMGFIFLIIGLVFVEKQQKKFYTIWLLSMILSLIILFIIIFNPNFIANVANGIKGWFS